MNYRGKRLFAGRLFAGRLWGPAADAGGSPAQPERGHGAAGHRHRQVARKRRRDSDEDVLMFLLR